MRLPLLKAKHWGKSDVVRLYFFTQIMFAIAVILHRNNKTTDYGRVHLQICRDCLRRHPTEN